ncbi:MAG: biotin synthase BioB [Chitinispirillaceae bacterium]|nr:biotin synthase BioB [Chitinispirillaceae bacterium]
MNLFDKTKELYFKAIEDKIDSDDIESIISWPEQLLSILFAATDQVRQYFHKNIVEPCSLMNIKSGGCSEDCAFCAQSAHNKAKIKITPLATEEEIKKRYEQAFSQNLPLCVVSSGRRINKKELENLCKVLKQCKGEKHASLGILDKEELKMLAEAGVICYNHNLETSARHYSKIVTTHSREERIKTVKSAKEVGLRVCCGGIFGMGESWNDRKEFALELKKLNVDTIPLNFFNPIEGTRLPPPKETPLEFLKITALFRLILPTKVIKICGGREFHLGLLQGLMFMAGANGYVTGGYLTTAGAGIDADKKLTSALGLSQKKA